MDASQPGTDALLQKITSLFACHASDYGIGIGNNKVFVKQQHAYG